MSGRRLLRLWPALAGLLLVVSSVGASKAPDFVGDAAWRARWGAAWNELDAEGQWRASFIREVRPGVMKADDYCEVDRRGVVYCGPDLYAGEPEADLVAASYLRHEATHLTRLAAGGDFADECVPYREQAAFLHARAKTDWGKWMAYVFDIQALAHCGGR